MRKTYVNFGSVEWLLRPRTGQIAVRKIAFGGENAILLGVNMQEYIGFCRSFTDAPGGWRAGRPAASPRVRWRASPPCSRTGADAERQGTTKLLFIGIWIPLKGHRGTGGVTQLRSNCGQTTSRLVETENRSRSLEILNVALSVGDPVEQRGYPQRKSPAWSTAHS